MPGIGTDDAGERPAVAAGTGAGAAAGSAGMMTAGWRPPPRGRAPGGPIGAAGPLGGIGDQTGGASALKASVRCPGSDGTAGGMPMPGRGGSDSAGMGGGG